MGCAWYNTNLAVEGRGSRDTFRDINNSINDQSTREGYSSDAVSNDERTHWASSKCLELPEQQDLFSKSISLNDFHVIKTIGKGTFSKVFLVSKMDSGKFYAMKVIKKKAIVDEADKKRVLQEKKIFNLVDHPFIVKLHHSFQTHQKFYFILDLVNGDQLYEYMLRKFHLKEKAVKFYAAELVLALKCLHENDIIYRDLKPSNILIDSQGHIKIIDFGLSTFANLNAVRQSIWGSPNYIAPEMLNNMKYSKMVDWWSLGAVLYEMISGYPPFLHATTKSEEKVYTTITCNQIKFSKKLSPALKDFLDGLLRTNPEERLGANGVEEIMKHDFFQGINWLDVKNKTLKPPYVPKVRAPDEVDLFNEDALKESFEEEQEKEYYEKPVSYKEKHVNKFTFSETSILNTTGDEKMVRYLTH